jgi:hypothetical protein
VLRWPDYIETHPLVLVWVVECEPTPFEWHVEHRWFGVHLGFQFSYDEQTDDYFGVMEDERYHEQRNFGPFSWGKSVVSYRGGLA